MKQLTEPVPAKTRREQVACAKKGHKFAKLPWAMIVKGWKSQCVNCGVKAR